MKGNLYLIVESKMYLYTKCMLKLEYIKKELNSSVFFILI